MISILNLSGIRCRLLDGVGPRMYHTGSSYAPPRGGVSRARKRVSQSFLNRRCERMRASEHAPRDPFRVLERRRGLAEIVGRRIAGIWLQYLV